MTIILFLITTMSLYYIFIILISPINPLVKKAINFRNIKKLKIFDVFITNISLKISKYVTFDDIKFEKIKNNLQHINYNISPELFKSKAIVNGVMIGLLTSSISIFFGTIMIPAGIFIGFSVYSNEFKKVEKMVKLKRLKIERELPQFAGTIRQCLSSTRSIISILTSYRKVCGAELMEEIDTTLNDIKLGNEEKALKSFEQRIGSAKVSELIRGLIAVVHGEDQRVYFEMLTHEYITAQNESIRRELLSRPSKLMPYIFILLFTMILMYGVAIFIYAKDQISIF